MRRRLRVLVLAALIGAAITVGSALAYSTVYAGPKTWNQGWDADSFYDDSIIPSWDFNEMGPKADDICFISSPPCTSRVTFIDGSGNWTYSHSDDNDWTVTSIPYPSYFYNKKPYCKNNSTYVYTAQCDAHTA